MIPLAKNIKRYFSLREIAIISLAIAISVSSGVFVFSNLKKEVVINDNGKTMVVRTMKSTVQEVLAQYGITVGPDDYINLTPGTRLQKIKTNRINIKRAVPIYVTIDGQEKKLMTYEDFVGDALIDGDVRLGGKDKLIGSTFSDRIARDMRLQVVRVQEKFFTEKEDVGYRTLTRANSRLDKGTEKVVREGKNGVREKVFKVIYENGKEVVRQLVDEKLVSLPVNKLVEFGTVLNFKTSRGDKVRYRKVIDMRATAYTSSFKDTGKRPGSAHFGITYSGMRARKGVIAVDPRVIPIGTRLYIEGVGNTPDYGFAVAGDIGGAIKGNLIDLYFDSQSYVDNWGCKNVKVYILID